MFKSKENKAMSELIEEQRQKESSEIWRRGWCVSEAALLEDTTHDNLLKLADKIYEYVYGKRD